MLGRVVRRGEEVRGAAGPVGGHGVGEWWWWCGGGSMVDEGSVVQVDEVGVEVEAEGLYAPRQGLVSDFLLPPPVHLLLVSARGVPERHPAGLGNVHVRETVGFDGFVVEPGTVARLPLEAADHAELGAAAARHVVASLLELDGRGAVEAALPPFFLCDLDELLRRGVLGAFAARVPFVVARAADFRPASLAFAILPAAVGTTAGVDGDVCGFDP